jgi:rhodanese-related sulfurtransferase
MTPRCGNHAGPSRTDGHDGTGVTKTIAQMLAEARGRYRRLSPPAAAAEQAEGAVLVDVRPSELRHAHGSIPGALVIGLNVLEWHVDPASPWHDPEFADHDVRIILICQEGYSSSLAAARLLELGLHRTTDVIDGVDGWRAAGLPVTPPG